MLSAVEALRSREPILLYDSSDREGETDIVVPAEGVTHEEIRLLREEAGGLVCVAVSPEAAERMGLPFARDVLEDYQEQVEYDDTSSFSLWVNHRETFTGITDKDRALTARKLAESVSDCRGEDYSFREEFSVPGHVPVLRAAENLLEDREGQTELSIALAEKAGITPAMLLCEMLDGETGEALSREDAVEFAERRGLPFVEGKDVSQGSPASLRAAESSS